MKFTSYGLEKPRLDEDCVTVFSFTSCCVASYGASRQPTLLHRADGRLLVTPRLHLEPEVDIRSKLTPNTTGWSVLGLKRFPLIGRPTRAVEPFKRAGNGARTHGLNLGKVPLYH